MTNIIETDSYLMQSRDNYMKTIKCFTCIYYDKELKSCYHFTQFDDIKCRVCSYYEKKTI